MEAMQETSLDAWIDNVPRSRMVYPESLYDRAKYFFWRLYTPCHPFIRDTVVSLRIMRHAGRQKFLLGVVHPDRSIEEFVSFLVQRGFGNHFVAWLDDGELVSLRRVENFAYQYHIRIFEDREVRGHYEYTPEYRPLSHLRQVGFMDRNNEFIKLLGDWIVVAEAEEKIR